MLRIDVQDLGVVILHLEDEDNTAVPNTLFIADAGSPSGLDHGLTEAPRCSISPPTRRNRASWGTGSRCTTFGSSPAYAPRRCLPHTTRRTQRFTEGSGKRDTFLQGFCRARR